MSELSAWLERYNLPLVRMLLVCLLHQCSAHPKIRELAVELSVSLAYSRTQPLHAGVCMATRCTTPPPSASQGGLGGGLGEQAPWTSRALSDARDARGRRVEGPRCLLLKL